jgi:hypothetical protein
MILEYLRNREVISTDEILGRIGRAVQDRTKRDQMEVARVLTHLRWTKKRCKTGPDRDKNFYHAPEGWAENERAVQGAGSDGSKSEQAGLLGWVAEPEDVPF